MDRNALPKAIRANVSEATILAHDAGMLADTRCPNAEHIESLSQSILQICSAVSILLDMVETQR